MKQIGISGIGFIILFMLILLLGVYSIQNIETLKIDTKINQDTQDIMENHYQERIDDLERRIINLEYQTKTLK